jgi:hypothetical protein
MSIKESLMVNGSIATPVVAVGAFYAWYLALAFVLFALVIIKQSIHD